MAYVLIVDDDTDFAGAVDTVLQSRGYESGGRNGCRTGDRAHPRTTAPTS